MNYFFTGKKAEILKNHSIDNLYDIIDRNTFVFFNTKNKQLKFVYYRNNNIYNFECTSLRNKGNSALSVIEYGSSYYYVNYQDKNYILFYDQEKDGFIFILVPEKQMDKNNEISHIWTLVNNNMHYYISDEAACEDNIAQTLLIEWDKNKIFFSENEGQKNKNDGLNIKKFDKQNYLYFLDVQDYSYISPYYVADGTSHCQSTYKLSKYLSIEHNQDMHHESPLPDNNFLQFHLRTGGKKHVVNKIAQDPFITFRTLYTTQSYEDEEKSYYVLFKNSKETYLSRLYDVNQILKYVVENYGRTLYMPITFVAFIFFYTTMKLKSYFTKKNNV